MTMLAETTTPTKSRSSAPPEYVRVLLRRALQQANADWLKKEGKNTPSQFDVLAAAAAERGASQTRLVEVTGIDRSTLASMVKAMVKRGLLQRRRTKEDARAYAVTITDEGRARLRTLAKVAADVDEVLVAGMTDRDTAALRGLLRMIVPPPAAE